jgi:hypothetical protein
MYVLSNSEGYPGSNDNETPLLQLYLGQKKRNAAYWISTWRWCPCSQGDPAEQDINQFKSHARLAQSVERETLTSTRSQGCGFDPRIGLFL